MKYIIGQDQRKLTPFELHDGDTFDLSKDPDVNKNKVQAMQYNSGMDEIFLELYEDQKDSTGALIPFDLSGANIMFEGWKPDGTYIVDSDIMTPISLQQGQCRINLPDQAFAVYGSYKQAFFRIYRDNKNIATLEFTFNVRADMVQGQIKSVDWIGPVHEILEKTKEDYENHKKSLDDAVSNVIAEYTKEMNTLKELGVSVDTSLSGLLQKIKDNNLFTQAEADAFKQAIEDKLAALDNIYEHTYPTLADLQADKTITAGKPLKTGGYYALGDGGGAIYDIMDTKPDAYYETLQNGLYAKLRYTPKVINVAQWGVSPSQDDNYDKIQMIFDKYGQGANIYFPNGRYNVSKTLILSAAYCRLVGDAETEFQKTTTDLSGYTCIFNSRTIDLSKLDVALIIGPANNKSETVYHHQIKLESMRFSSPDVTSFDRANYGIIAIGTAYLSLSHCFAYGFYLNIKQYESFGLNLSQTQSNGALSTSLFLDHSIHVSAVDCGFESLRPQDSAIVATNESIATITGSVVTVNGVAADTSSDLTLVGCSYETNYQTFRATSGATINVIGGNIERHQDPANSADTPLVYCTDNSKVYVDSASWRWQNYSGSPTWDHLLSYSTNQGCKIVITNCQFSNFPKLTHYDGGADYVIWDQDFDVYKTYTAQINPADGVTVQGQTLQRNHDGQCFLNVGFTVTKELGYMQSLLSFPPSFKPWDGCYIQFLQQKTKNTYQAFTGDGQIKVYDTVPAGTEAILTFSYQAKD